MAINSQIRWRFPVSRAAAACEVGMLLGLFWLVGGWPPPEVNEAHYLAKAKHYWNAEWCQGDRFLDSADAHLVFYWSVGWLTRLAPLPVVAWIARGVAWLLLACAWRSLCGSLFSRSGLAVIAAAIFLAFQQRCHMSGEWVVGGAEGKAFAYAFVFWGLSAMARGSWNAGWIFFGAAGAFHVLVGGWAAVCALLVWLALGQSRPPLARMLSGLAVGLLLALPGLLPGLALTWNTPAEIVRMANALHVFDRLRHHLQISSFDTLGVLRFLMLTTTWLILCLEPAANTAQRTLRLATAAALLVALAGAGCEFVLSRHPAWAAALLKYYWFRLADVYLPLSVACEIVALLTAWRAALARTGTVAFAVAALAAGLLLAPATYRARWGSEWSSADLQSPMEDVVAWRKVCQWIAEHTPENALVHVPRDHYTFKWYAGRAEVVNWKDVPQDARSVVAWQQTQRDLWGADFSQWFRRWHFSATELSDERLLDMAHKYGFRLIVVERRLAVRPLPFPRVYPTAEFPNQNYDIYRVPLE